MVLMGKIIAWVLIVFGGLRTITGIYVATFVSDAEAYAAASAYLLGTKTSGEAIDQGLIMIGLGVAMGLLAQIASNRE
ncbi:hypothetical protein NBRC116598_37810 [Pseudophaeobacter arcticus]|uniref:Uncharacterized protein n=1 Tax=Pseudophaeobacter arcticus TaxID=385492 RepID=A0ABQ0AR35_9RHOB